MKKLILFFAAFLVCQLSEFNTFAQNYRPFKSDQVYHFIARDSIYSMSAYYGLKYGPDSTIVFNQSVKKGLIRSGSSNCIGTPTTYHEQKNNQFGEGFIIKPGGEYVFYIGQGTLPATWQPTLHFLLKTKIPVGNSWVMNASANLSATLTSRTTATFNSVTDSVLNYSLSDGSQIILSKHYGFVKAPNFTAYVANSDFKKRSLHLYKLPESQYNYSIYSPFEIFDFQPNDQFSYYKDENTSIISCYSEWRQHKVLSRKNSIGGDTIYYKIEIQKLTQKCGNSTRVLSHPVVQNLIITANYKPEVSLLTNEFLPDSRLFNRSDRALVNTHVKRDSVFHQREILHFTDLNSDPYYAPNCDNTFHYSPDVERYVKYGKGLGKIYDFSIDMWPNITYEYLEAYIKGTETYGTWHSLAQIMAMGTKPAKDLSQDFSAYPNPFSNQLSLKFSDTFKTGNATLSILNVLGQEIYNQQVSADPNQEIKLNVPDMAKGLYILQVSQQGKTFTTRLVKH